MEKKTPLYECHLAEKGKMVPFGGYLLPVQYGDTGLVKEHLNVRTSVGLFDVSHMGEIFIEGEDALENVQYLFTNDFSKMKNGQIKYTLMCNEEGGIIDDLILYKYTDNKFMGVVNASNKAKDYSWLSSHSFGNVTISDRSENIGLIAIQGPNSRKVLEKLIDSSDFPEKYYTFKENICLDTFKVDISQTGYTGEEGFELYTHSQDVVAIWQLLMAVGKEEGIMLCGLGARDTLRLEAGMPLYGHEMNEAITPFQVGLQFAVKLDKKDFIGKQALVELKSPSRVRVGLKIIGRGIAREESPILVEGKRIGATTSGTHAPYLGYGVAMGFVEKEYTEIGTNVQIEVRGRHLEAEIVSLPFYKKQSLI